MPAQPAFAPSFVVVGEALAPTAISLDYMIAFGASSFTNNTVVACTMLTMLIMPIAPSASTTSIIIVAYMGSPIACSSIIAVVVVAPLPTATAQKVIWLHQHLLVCSWLVLEVAVLGLERLLEGI